MNTQLALVGTDELMQGILMPVGISFFASVARIALWGWKGVRHFAATLYTGCFAGVMAHWILAHCNLEPTINAIIISSAALLSRDGLSLIFSRRLLARARRAVGDRLADEIINRGRPARSHGKEEY